MPSRLARLVTITYGDGDYEQYENVTVQETRFDRNMDPKAIPEKYKTLTVVEGQLIAKGSPVPPTRPSPTTGVKHG